MRWRWRTSLRTSAAVCRAQSWSTTSESLVSAGWHSRSYRRDCRWEGAASRYSPRGGGLRCLYAWALAGDKLVPVTADWMLLRVQPEWALERPPKALSRRGLETLVELGAKVLVLVPSSVAARQVADMLGPTVSIDAHPRFLPHLEAHDSEANLLLWPHDALGAASLRRRGDRHADLGRSARRSGARSDELGGNASENAHRVCGDAREVGPSRVGVLLAGLR